MKEKSYLKGNYNSLKTLINLINWKNMKSISDKRCPLFTLSTPLRIFYGHLHEILADIKIKEFCEKYNEEGKEEIYFREAMISANLAKFKNYVILYNNALDKFRKDYERDSNYTYINVNSFLNIEIYGKSKLFDSSTEAIRYAHRAMVNTKDPHVKKELKEIIQDLLTANNEFVDSFNLVVEKENEVIEIKNQQGNSRLKLLSPLEHLKVTVLKELYKRRKNNGI